MEGGGGDRAGLRSSGLASGILYLREGDVYIEELVGSMFSLLEEGGVG